MALRVEQLSLTGQPGPVSDCHIDCGAITVLVGKNDSGKSFLLEGIDAALRDDASWHFSALLEIFARADDRWLEALDRVDNPSEADALRDAHPRPPREMAGDLHDQLALTGATEEGRLVVLVAPTEGLPVHIWLCTAPWSGLPEELRSRVSEAWPAGADIARARPWRPLPLVPIAAAESGALLEPIRVPSTTEALEARVGRSVVRLARALRLLTDRGGEHVDWDGLGLAREGPPHWAHDEHPEFVDSPRWLLTEIEDETEVSSTGAFVCSLMSSLTGDVLPSFITSRYRIDVATGGITAIARGQAMAIGLEDLTTGLWFPLKRAASGHRVWLQLALSEVASRVDWYARVLDVGAQRLQQLVAGGELLDEADRDQMDAIALALRQMLFLLDNDELLRRGVAEAVVDHRYEGFTAEGVPASATLFDPPRQRLYLIDEPEQRLHPAVQRRVAEWLVALMEEWGAQCVLATHALAFIDVRGDTRVHEVVREAAAAAVTPVDMAAFDPQTQLAREMGFDRGEMLAR